MLFVAMDAAGTLTVVLAPSSPFSSSSGRHDGGVGVIGRETTVEEQDEFVMDALDPGSDKDIDSDTEPGPVVELLLMTESEMDECAEWERVDEEELDGG